MGFFTFMPGHREAACRCGRNSVDSDDCGALSMKSKARSAINTNHGLLTQHAFHPSLASPFYGCFLIDLRSFSRLSAILYSHLTEGLTKDLIVKSFHLHTMEGKGCLFSLQLLLYQTLSSSCWICKLPLYFTAVGQQRLSWGCAWGI